MTVELIQTLSLIAYIFAGVLFLLAVALFFLLDVPKLYNDISGRTARKAIEKIRQQNESSGNKAYKPSAVNAERGKLTDRITKSGRLQPKTESPIHVSVGTEKFETSMLAPQSNETSVLSETSNETTVLNESSNETTVLSEQISETTLLTEASNETTLLTGALPTGDGQTASLISEAVTSAPEVADGEFTVDVEMAFTGSAEIIE